VSDTTNGADAFALQQLVINDLTEKSKSLSEDNQRLSQLVADMSEAMDKMASVVQSHENHNDKTAKLMSAQFADLQRTRQKWAYVVEVNKLLQREPIYTVDEKLDVILLSTSTEFLAEPYNTTPYCAYLLLEVSGKAQVIFESQGQVVAQSGARIPLTKPQKEELATKIMAHKKQDIIEAVNEGLQLLSVKSSGALASEQSLADIKDLGEHFMSEPSFPELAAHFKEIMKRYGDYKRELASRVKQHRKHKGR
jgi:hypothetical protein